MAKIVTINGRKVRVVRSVPIAGRKLRIVRRRTHANFVPFYSEWEQTIRANAYRARVPGWDREDVEAEMAYSLWVAYKTHDASKQTDFGVFFWSIWNNRRKNQIRWYNAQKRAAEELPFSHEELIAMSPIIYPGQLVEVPAEVTGELANLVWSLIGLGYTMTEVKAALHLNNHRYYAIIQAFATASVHDWLTNQY